ncbi:MAG TPA: Holliday junction branch migration protein RuvA [Rectinemataceae bacterium]
MFNRIYGTLTGRRGDSIFVLASGLEWDISVPMRATGLFGQVGSDVEVFLWLHHWDEGMKLYGFPTERERELFLDLNKVEGIGPRQAIKILSGISPAELAAALESGDLKALQRVSGVGPKLAQKMVLALKGKLVGIEEEAPSRGSASVWHDLVSSLVDMGFDRKSVETAVGAKAAEFEGRADAEKELFRAVLLELSAGGGR